MANKPQTLSEGQRGEVTKILRNQVLTGVLTGLAILGGITGVGLWQIKARVERNMEQLVAKQFEEPAIQEVVRRVASERADAIMVAQVQPEVRQFKADVADQLQEVHTLVEKTRALERETQKHKDAIAGVFSDVKQVSARIGDAESRLAHVETNLALAASQVVGLTTTLVEFDEQFRKVTDEQHFLALANRARLYSLDAFLELDRLSQTTNLFAKDAGQIVWALRRDMEIDRQSFTEYVPVERIGEEYEYKGPFTSEEIAYRLRIPSGIESAANAIRKENLKCFLPELVTLAAQEKNLWVENRITHAISALSGQTHYPWTLEGLSNWWQTSSSQYTNWPYARFEKGIELLNATKYKDALCEFDAIIASDAYADRSRAYALACAIEIGDTNKVAAFSSGWKYPEGRWARWAKARHNISTGDIAQATTQFAELAADCRTFPDIAAMDPRNRLLRQVDWALYNQTLKELLARKKEK